MKMAVVGCEASGKTVFMCALADYYGRDAANNPMRLKLTPENAAANSFERFQFRQMRCLRQWPPATPPDRTIDIKWSLRHDGKSLAEIDMLEFGGETFRAAFRDIDSGAKHEGATAELLNYLSDGDFFVVLVSIKSLLTNPTVFTEDDFDRETEALWVTRGIIEFVKSKRPNAGIIIGLTQADKYRNELGEAGSPREFFASHWPTVAALAENIPVVEVASVSKVNEDGDPAEGYHTRGILSVMRAFSKYCFGDENALENHSIAAKPKKVGGKGIPKWLKAAIIAGSIVALGALAYIFNSSNQKAPVEETFIVPAIIEKVVTNNVTQVVNTQVTNIVEKLIERPVTNTIERIIEQTVQVPVTNIVETFIEVPVTNTVERTVEKVVTNFVERIIERQAPVVAPVVVPEPAPVAVAEPQPAPSATDKDTIPPGYRVWTDYNGRKIIAKWIGTAVDESGITILSKYNRRIDAVLWKFSPEDQAYIKAELKRHADKNEVLSDGIWVRNPLLKNY